MKKVVLLSTGGTIASKQDPDTGLMMAGEQTGRELLAQCNEKLFREKNIEVDVESVFQVPSNQMNFQRCLTLISLMNKKLATEKIDGFVITHGTDTLEETAYFISLFWDTDVPVAITGAQFSPTENNTDAFHNITNAILVAGDTKSKKSGVVVCFNDRILPAQYAVKSHSSNLDGFSAPNSGPIGIVDFGRVHYFHYPAHRECFPLPLNTLKKVEIIKSYMGMDTAVFDFHINNGVAGLVVEGFGRGHVDIATAEKIQYATQKGVPVIVCTGCFEGEPAEVYGFPGALHDVLEKGGVNGRDYDAKKARIKLIAILSTNETNIVSTETLQGYFDSY